MSSNYHCKSLDKTRYFSFKTQDSKNELLFKKGIKTETKSYRPISLLPLMSKMIVKSIHDQRQNCLQRNQLLYIYQSGFRANHSTEICLSRFTEMILNGAENEKHTGMILIYVQNAVDTLDQKILLEKLK